MLLVLLAAGPLCGQSAGKPVNAGTDSGRALVAPVGQENFSMVIFGDRTTGPDSGLRVLAEAVTMANRLAPDFVITVGDHINGYNRTAQWLPQMKRYKRYMAKLDMPWYPVAGNHDTYGYRGAKGGNLANYKKHFGPLYYSFDYRFAHIVALFSDESLSFSNPAVNQNMSKAQMAWLRKDLQATPADIVFCFLHHPRWTPGYRGCNWPRVHEILKRDGRVKAVFAGHLHLYRDDGVQDGIHYYTLAATGGRLNDRLGRSAAIHHVDHVRVWKDRISVAVIPVGSIQGGDMVLGSELDEMIAMGAGEWLGLEGKTRMEVDGSARSTLKVTITNPARRVVRFQGRIAHGKGWTVAGPVIEGELRPGEQAAFPVEIVAPRFDGEQPSVAVEAALVYGLKSGLEQPIEVRRTVPVEIRGLAAVSAADPAENKVLVLDGRSAVRVDLPAVKGPLTLECWARGAAPRGRVGLATRTQSANFGLFWTPWPQANCYVSRRGPDGKGGRGYLTVKAGKGWDWGRWNHLAMAYDGRECRFYVNGRLQGKAVGEGPVANPRFPFYVGADPDGGGRATSFFRGAIDELRLSSVARYREEFTPRDRFTRDRHTLLLLHFDGGKHPRVFPDDSGRGHHGWAVSRPRREIERLPAPGSKGPRQL